MTLIEALEEVAAMDEIALPLVYAELYEANYGFDNIKTYPTIVVIPFIMDDEIGVSGLIQSEVPLQVFFLDRLIEQKTDEIVTRETEPLVQAMRLKARKFFHHLSQHEVTDQTKPYEKITHTPTYNAMDSHSHGVVSNTTVHVVENEQICDD